LSSRRQSFVRPNQNARSRLRSKLGIDATKKIPGEGFKRLWPPLIKMDAAVKAKVEKLFNL
jgi:3-polyprenyl-4-hydroxybenzoate decarboxylase